VFWSEPDIVRITFMDEGTVISTVNVVGGTAYELSRVDVPERTGYKLVGWSADSLSPDAEYMIYDSISVTENMSLHTIWEKLLSVSFHLDDGTKIVYVETGSDIPLGTAEKEGYNFKGWTQSGNDSLLNGTIAVYKNMDLYPEWEKRTTTIVVPADDRDGTDNSGTLEPSTSDGGVSFTTIGIVGATIAALVAVSLFVARRS
jgi:hypothetical protein